MEQRFEYRMPIGRSILGIVLGLGIAGFVGYALATGLGLSYLSVVRLPPELARWLFIVMLVLGLAVLVGSALALAAGRREVVVSPARIRVPKGELSRTHVELAPASVRRIAVEPYQQMATLVIEHDRGTTKLRSPYFESPAAFDACVQAVDRALARP